MSPRREAHNVLSPGELQAEFDSLRTLRRRSLSTNSDGRIDPDLPGSSLNPPPSSPMARLPQAANDDAAAAAAQQDDPDASLSGQVDSLFWLPAHLHPELAPQQFKEFIKEQTTPEALARRSASVSRSASSSAFPAGPGRSASSITRRKSMLSKQIDPSEADSDAHLRSNAPFHRSDSASRLRRRGTQLDRLTLADLHKLEELSRAARSGAPEGEEQLMKNIMERSVNSSILNANQGEGEAPLNVPAPGSILRRSAISKVRKPSLLGDGGGHRFGPSRRPTRRMSDHTSDRTPSSPSDQATDAAIPASGTDLTASPIHEDTAAAVVPEASSSSSLPTSTSAPNLDEHERFQPALRLDTASLGVASDQSVPEHKRSASDDSFLDAYINQSPIDNRSSWPSASSPSPSSSDPFPPVDPSSPSSSKQWPSEELTVPTDSLSAPQTPIQTPSTSTSSLLSTTSSSASSLTTSTAPTSAPISSSYLSPSVSTPAPSTTEQPLTSKDATQHQHQHQPQQLTPQSTTSSAPPPPPPTKEKPEKKSAWARLGLSRVASSIRDDADSDDASAHASSSSSNSTHSASKKKDKRSKKSSVSADRDSAEEHSGSSSGSGFFGGLFSSSSSSKKRTEPVEPLPHQQVVLPTSSGCFRDGEFVNFYRLPIHVERAVYRLSHLKLANPKRALYEQVLISNLMFWYLSAMNQPKPPNQPMTSAEMLDLADPQPGRGSPNPVAPLDLPMPDTHTPKGPPGASQPVISPLSSYPPANSNAPLHQQRPPPTPSSTASTSNGLKQQHGSSAQPQSDVPPQPYEKDTPSSSSSDSQRYNRSQDAFKVVRGNSSSSSRDPNRNPQSKPHESNSSSSSTSASGATGNAALLTNHRKQQGRDVPWEQYQQSPAADAHSASPELFSRPRREASLRQQQHQPNGYAQDNSKSEDDQHRTGRQEHIVV